MLVSVLGGRQECANPPATNSLYLGRVPEGSNHEDAAPQRRRGAALMYLRGHLSATTAGVSVSHKLPMAHLAVTAATSVRPTSYLGRVWTASRGALMANNCRRGQANSKGMVTRRPHPEVPRRRPLGPLPGGVGASGRQPPAAYAFSQPKATHVPLSPPVSATRLSATSLHLPPPGEVEAEHQLAAAPGLFLRGSAAPNLFFRCGSRARQLPALCRAAPGSGGCRRCLRRSADSH